MLNNFSPEKLVLTKFYLDVRSNDGRLYTVTALKALGSDPLSDITINK